MREDGDIGGIDTYGMEIGICVFNKGTYMLIIWI